ncbi:MAG: hypothetical protein RIE06_05535 [Roseibium album]|uniref:Uncharacterized protein n=1 Tax=Roseibium album TaxID=311410 RepID=A0A0M7AVD9_9HYPH|nr:hypothetical protein [Roseibium album]MBG6148501.1 hypothetical protein [Labrenzia sp. EL_142]MBG6154615.1 hypothetical protein [Labrenzia sp. EL_162]MBG6161893.1 hypothetical protein [Labrenzia sp. EL_195]MBG6176351.1 hypothetical protein [Labrenzia sp. EL_132]MBG6193255.1 hypothetical protein [Labrenzia sp. EL_159]MBG6199621.1 hypothetical protein [Labrenzia sp. EL_13]MBG6209975.1 hypothetical protein [Labrenzia sp. EL_126]MBG6231180.1 hypothetical protein [Labrenzia sp. EL_208]MCR905
MQDVKPKLTPEEESKDEFFRRVSEISEEMIEEHGKDFAMGTLVMAAQWIARGEVKGSDTSRH